jgi:transcription elongation factor GreA
MEQIALTPQGKKKIQEELAHRKDVLRPGIIKDIEEARAHGDLSENSEYHDARERHSMNEGLISHLETQLASSIVIDITTKEPSAGEDRKILFGCTVELVELDEEGVEIDRKDQDGNLITDDDGNSMIQTWKWKLVGVHEADLIQNKLSYKSPIGKALIGRFSGETIEVQVPTGIRIFDIEQVLYC